MNSVYLNGCCCNTNQRLGIQGRELNQPSPEVQITYILVVVSNPAPVPIVIYFLFTKTLYAVPIVIVFPLLIKTLYAVPKINRQVTQVHRNIITSY